MAEFFSGQVYLIHDNIYCTSAGGFVPPLWAMVAESVSSLLVMINFSGNFLIYCSTLKPFKAYLARWCTVCTKPSWTFRWRSEGGAACGGRTNMCLQRPASPCPTTTTTTNVTSANANGKFP